MLLVKTSKLAFKICFIRYYENKRVVQIIAVIHKDGWFTNLVGDITSIKLVLKMSKDKLIERSLRKWHRRLNYIGKKTWRNSMWMEFWSPFDFWSNDACETFLEIIKPSFIGQKGNEWLSYWNLYILLYEVHYV